MQDGLYCKADAVLQGGRIARWLMLQGVASGKGVLQGRMLCCKAGVLQGGWCCKAGVLQGGLVMQDSVARCCKWEGSVARRAGSVARRGQERIT